MESNVANCPPYGRLTTRSHQWAAHTGNAHRHIQCPTKRPLSLYAKLNKPWLVAFYEVISSLFFLGMLSVFGTLGDCLLRSQKEKHLSESIVFRLNIFTFMPHLRQWCIYMKKGFLPLWRSFLAQIRRKTERKFFENYSKSVCMRWVYKQFKSCRKCDETL